MLASGFGANARPSLYGRRSLVIVAACLGLAACGQNPAPQSGNQPAASADDSARAAQIAERERAVAEREAAVAAREQQQIAQAATAAQAEAQVQAEASAEAAAQAERERAAADAAAAQAVADKAAADKAAADKKAAAERQRLAAERAAAERKARREKAADDEAKAKAAAAARPIQVAAGTRLAVALKQPLSSKTASIGQPFEAVLTSDVVGAEGRVAVPAGATLTGTITHVVSGSRNIGATPLIGLRFDHLITSHGQRIAISGELSERGASERGRDSAKIIGGAAAGAVLGNQSRHNDRGKVIGALVGGALGALAAKNTGTEVSLEDGAPLTITLAEAFTVTPGSKGGG